MRIVGFVQAYNEVANGHLATCLHSLAILCDAIVVYDDASTEDTRSVYEQFGCTVIYGQQQAFSQELFHKQALLPIALRYRPDWLIWIDSDTLLGRFFEDRTKVEQLFEQVSEQSLVRLHLHNLNLWRSPHWRRVDNKFDDLWHGVCWRNTGELHYRPVGRLHQKQYPHAFRDPEQDQMTFLQENRFSEVDGPLLHLGFAEDVEIARKYYTYRAHGQRDWALNRLVDESQLILEPVPPELFPTWYLPYLERASTERPSAVHTIEEFERHGTFDAWLCAYRSSASQPGA